ncbi:MAG: helix-turn-helix domain-containing protein [Chitinophagaceae bacterium]|nr:helix-turn-helix domain-containing protein [Chitinophagaceae bacterium]
MNKIKSLRAGLGISQEELAEKTGLSLRTIQRIENGETMPRGDSLRRLCQALGVSMEELKEDKVEKTLEENRGFLVLMNLSALAFLLPWPGLGIAVPLALWVIYRDKIEGVRSMGRRIVNFQITWLLVKGGIYVFVILVEFNHYRIPGVTYMHFILFLLIPDAFNINCIVVNAIRANKKKTTDYAPAIGFLAS